MRKSWLLALLCALAVAPATAQVRQSSTVTPRHLACWTTTGVIQDCGTAANPFATSMGTVGEGPTICANSAAVTGPYNRLCLAANTGSNAQISLQNFGGAPAQGLEFNINGTIVSITGSTNAPAVTLYGNPTNASTTAAFFTVNSLVELVAPNASTDFLLIWDSTAGTFKKINSGTIASSATAGVSSLGGMTGALTCGLGTVCSGSTLSLRGSTVTTITTSTALASTNGTVLCDATSGNVALTLPTASSGISGTIYRIKKIDSSANICTLAVTGGGNIDTTPLFTLSGQGDALTVQTNSSQWWII